MVVLCILLCCGALAAVMRVAITLEFLACKDHIFTFVFNMSVAFHNPCNMSHHLDCRFYFLYAFIMLAIINKKLCYHKETVRLLHNIEIRILR